MKITHVKSTDMFSKRREQEELVIKRITEQRKSKEEKIRRESSD